MRLIDADLLIKYIPPEEYGAIFAVNNCPTAYDVDKVVGEINEESWEYMSDFGDTRVIDFADAIDIVRRGGINE